MFFCLNLRFQCFHNSLLGNSVPKKKKTNRKKPYRQAFFTDDRVPTTSKLCKFFKLLGALNPRRPHRRDSSGRQQADPERAQEAPLRDIPVSSEELGGERTQ